MPFHLAANRASKDKGPQPAVPVARATNAGVDVGSRSLGRLLGTATRTGLPEAPVLCVVAKGWSISIRRFAFSTAPPDCSGPPEVRAAS
jgi:hypothetical protein